MPRDNSYQPFYLIVADRGVFAVEGPMTDDRPWNEAASYARNHQHRVVRGSVGVDRDELAAEYRHTHSWPAFHQAASFGCAHEGAPCSVVVLNDGAEPRRHRLRNNSRPEISRWWLTPAEAADLGQQWVERYGPRHSRPTATDNVL
jgi:hypothetical protein